MSASVLSLGMNTDGRVSFQSKGHHVASPACIPPLLMWQLKRGPKSLSNLNQTSAPLGIRSASLGLPSHIFCVDPVSAISSIASLGGSRSAPPKLLDSCSGILSFGQNTCTLSTHALPYPLKWEPAQCMDGKVQVFLKRQCATVAANQLGRG